ncbi:serine hydrolase [Patescibacteria group bacterium]|nr:serine hydrolase [Patescibacteria group bacterium]
MFGSILVTILTFLAVNGVWLVPIALDNYNLIDNLNLSEYSQEREIKIIKSPLLKNYLEKEEVINIEATKAVLYDPKADVFLYEKNADNLQAIASITKLMTALVILDQNPNWQEVHEMKNIDRREGGRIHLFLGDRITLENLFNVSLVSSANTATLALVHALDFTEAEFVDLMNLKAKELGLVNTHFNDPIGLSPKNVSTAKELALLSKEAFANDLIQDTLSQSNYSFQTEQGKIVEVESTNKLLADDLGTNDLEVISGKTGYIKEAGYCFSALYNDKNSGELITIILDSDTVFSRFTDSLKISKWIYDY